MLQLDCGFLCICEKSKGAKMHTVQRIENKIEHTDEFLLSNRIALYMFKIKNLEMQTNNNIT